MNVYNAWNPTSVVDKLHDVDNPRLEGRPLESREQ